ncbi:MAG: amino acid adenylation domain-containing protein, partial [Candidatus Aminicenantes bacterium]|nr:amino acid adenylation domain-containing protein [Candidatus Aminicenantes bacterium]NIM77278.1 amino acid adenylation domain-containing protein [Candidatus Aminicenantes bacterium]NIN16579.1 amino acid adenylation domain-containing protein [Candidatus Aminicenantes bacterium]NIN40437.1 amino acid adenylation domain-containing protein [Candidatus Aminicenantes bacterium]NIN83257.1 amino acid adenylation domain-containing protein [Candidatus Aminicenantes bacterium]
VNEAVVLVREDSSGDKYLCAYVVAVPASQQVFNVLELREYLSRDLPDYMVPGYIVTLDKMPLTANGKVDRAALPIPEVGEAAQHGYTAPRNRLEQKLVELWSDVLKVNHKHLGIDANFIEMGGHSLKATLLVSKIHKAFAVDVPLAEIFTRPTIRELARYIGAAKQDKYLSIEPTELKDYYPLSSAQKRLYILQQLDVDSTAYNIPEFMALAGNLKTDRLECTFNELIARHESLRTCFEMIGDDPLQRIHDEVEFAIDYNDQKLPTANCQLPTDLIRPFDLSQAPLFRVGLIHTPAYGHPSQEGITGDKHILMVDMHHIISDGTSVGVMIREFMALYEGEDLPPVRIQYKDFSGWQNSEREKKAIKEQERYWLKEFAGEIPVLNFSSDYARPVIQDFTGKTMTFQIDREQAQKLKILAGKEDASLYMVLLTLYNILLSKLSGQEDIVVGCPVAGRRHGDLENVIGMFVNTLALRNYPAGEKRLNEFFREIRERTLTAFENQEYQFENLVDQLAVNRDASRNPLFDVVLVMQNLDISEIQIPGLKLSPVAYENKISKFDMTWTATESEKGIFFAVNYCTKLFKMETMNRLTGYFKKIVAFILEYPEVTIQDIEIITEEEKEQVMYRFNDTRTAYPNDKTIHELFEEQAERTPDGAAVVGSWQGVAPPANKEEITGETVQLSYRELNKESDQLAYGLRSKGVGPDTIVGIMVERSVEMIIGILGILKAGGAYLPIDPDYPEEHKKYMLEDSNIRILLAAPEAQVKVKDKRELIEVINISKELSSSTLTLTSTSSQVDSADRLAYVIYTSGSTGRPKGVLVGQQNVVRLVKNTNYIEFRENERILQTGALEFDASTFEIWGSLLNGLTLYLVPEDDILNPGTLKQNIRKFDISTMWLTSPLFNQLCGEDVEIFAGLKNLLVGGDVLSPVYINMVRERFLELNVINGYGPTENTTFSTTYSIKRNYTERIPIGKPIANSTAYIVDRWNQLVPLGVVGELSVGGDGVSRGYLNNPELTKEKFVNLLNHEATKDTKEHEEEKKVRRSEIGSPRRGSYYSSFIIHRLYRTGDLVRWLPDGTIEFLGRIDQQVKIRGYRIELGEIEKRLLNHASVREAVVVARDPGGGKDRYICAYIVPQSSITDRSRSFDVSELREYLTRELPGHMIPSYFIRLDSIPLTPNGKVDRKVLPVPENTRSYLKTTYVQPETEMEKIVADTWKEVLGVDKAGINDNFFELGGNSLNIVQLASKLKKVLGRDIPTVTLFRFPKITTFLEYLDGMGENEEKEKAKIGVTGKERSEVVAKGKNMMRRSIQKRRRQQI